MWGAAGWESFVESQLPPIVTGYGYGSGVMPQVSPSRDTASMVDVIVVVDDPIRWHEENIERNPGHYSVMKRFGAVRVTQVQDHWGARMYYLPQVRWGPLLFKYGIITVDALCEDLLHWSHLFVAGRLHKPVRVLGIPPSPIQRAMEVNLNAAIASSVLFSGVPGESVGLASLYRTIAQLSYTGDVRMGVAEAPNKVSNIIRGGLDQFHNLYYSRLTGHVWKHLLSVSPASPSVMVNDAGLPDPLGTHVSIRTESMEPFLRMLPAALLRSVAPAEVAKRSHAEVSHELAQMPRNTVIHSLRTAMAQRVRRSSITQTSKGLLSAGVWKSISYVGRKFVKRLRG